MGKVRVGQLAKELNIKVTEAIARLKELGIDAKSNLSTVEDIVASRLRTEFAAAGGGARAGKPAAPKVPKIVTIKKPGSPVPPGVTLPTIPKPVAPPPPPPAAVEGVHPEKSGSMARPSGAAPLAPARPGTPAAPLRPGMPVRPGGPGTGPVRPGTAPGSTPSPGPRPVVTGGAGRVGGALPTGALRPGTTPRPGVPGSSAMRPGVVPARPAMPPSTRPPLPGTRPGPSLPSRTGPPAMRPAGASGGVARPRPAPGADPRRPVAAAATGGSVPAPTPARPSVPPPPPVPLVFQDLTITEGVTVKELAEKMDRKAKDIIGRLLARGILATMNQPLDTKLATEVCHDLGFNAKVVSFEEEVAEEEAKESKPGDLRPRDPVVTIMGHVDHGKTSLLDAVRSWDIVAGEAGGITQHIGAYHIRHKNRGITFIDTPGHEAFTMMRARGSRVTDLVVLVVAADDGVMPQTIEAIAHARAAGVPIVVAINKVDKPGANLDRVKKQLSDQNLLVEDWGGQTVAVPVSAQQKKGIDELLEMILLVADLADLKSDPSTLAAGTVLESRLDKSRGAVATVLVQRGTLNIGDPFIAGAVHGKVRAMFDDLGRRSREAG